MLASAAQVEQRLLAAAAAQNAARRQQQAAEKAEIPVNPFTHLWLTVGGDAFDTAARLPAASMRSPPAGHSRHFARKPRDSR